MSGHAVTPATQYEVVAAWSVPQKVIGAVAAAPGWECLGEYYLPSTVKAAKLDVVGFISIAGITLDVRLWDVTAKAAVNGAVSITSILTPVRAIGEAVTLTGGRTYQVHAQCTGAVGGTRFGVVTTATISD